MKKFEPQGVTLLYLLSESHVSIHTWPESNACALDFYHCGPHSLRNLRIAEEKFCNLFGWENCTSTIITRRGQTTSLLTNDFVDKTDILRNVKMLHREKSPYQEIRVYDTMAHGRILILEGIIQFSTMDLLMDDYTLQMVQHVIKKEQQHNKVLIVGGGDLIIATYILKNYPLVKKVVLAELDERVIEVTKQFFSYTDIIQKEIESGRLEI